MKKIAFTAMTMQPLRNPLYSLSGKSRSSYSGKINFPLNAALAEKLDESDELTVCIIKVTDGLTAKSEETFRKNEEVFRDELSRINESIGAKIQYKIIESDFSETRDAFGKRFMEMFEILENGCKIYAWSNGKRQVFNRFCSCIFDYDSFGDGIFVLYHRKVQKWKIIEFDLEVVVFVHVVRMLYF